MIFNIDFDGTCTTHNFPHIGKDIGAAPVLKQLVEKGHKLILWTIRCDHDFDPVSDQPEIIAKKGKYLSEAIEWFTENEIPLWGINKNPEQQGWSSSPKSYAHITIDDSALGCPLLFDEKGKMYADWVEIERILKANGLI